MLKKNINQNKSNPFEAQNANEEFFESAQWPVLAQYIQDPYELAGGAIKSVHFVPGINK